MSPHWLPELRSRLRHLPVATKIAITLTAILTLMGSAGVVATVQSAKLSGDIRELTSGALPLLRSAYGVETLGGEVAAMTAVYVTSGDPSMLQALAQKRAEFGGELRALHRLASMLPITLPLDRVDLLARSADSAVVHLSSLAVPPRGDTADQPDSVQSRAALLQVGLGQLAQLRLALNEELQHSVQSPLEREVNAVFARATRRSNTQVVVTAGLLILALLVSAVAAERLSDDINEPLRKLVRASTYLSAGRLSQPVQVDSSREFNSLAAAFNRMAQRLDFTVREMQQAAEKAELANAAKSTFVSEVSHELRTPLTSLRGSLILLTKKGVDPTSESGKRMLQVALSSTERLVRLINDRLDIDRIEAGQLSLRRDALLPAALVEEATTNVRTLAEERGVRLEIRGESPPWAGDHDRLIQVLVNLIGNAISFSPAGATVRIRLATRAGTGRVEVSDDGAGISQDQQQTLFRPFTQAHKRRRGGTGLGLAIAKGIVSEHGGEIGVESEPGKGATFWFTVPLASPDLPSWRRHTPVATPALAAAVEG